MKKICYLFSLFACALCLGCSPNMKKWTPINDHDVDITRFAPVFNKEEIKPLKKQLPRLYKFLKNEHLWGLKHTEKNNDSNFLYCSKEFYQYSYDKLRTALFQVDFFKDYSNLVATFGQPAYTVNNGQTLIVALVVHYPHFDGYSERGQIGQLEYDMKTQQLINNVILEQKE